MPNVNGPDPNIYFQQWDSTKGDTYDRLRDLMVASVGKRVRIWAGSVLITGHMHLLSSGAIGLDHGETSLVSGPELNGEAVTYVTWRDMTHVTVFDRTTDRSS